MKSIAFASALAALASRVAAHYTFPQLVVGGTATTAWQYVRMTDNHYSNGPVTDVTTSEMKCYENATASATSTVSVAAGSTIGFTANGPIYHNGYLDVYLSKVDTANDETAGSGASWFKIYEMVPYFVDASTGYVFPSLNLETVTFTIPSAVPSGQYLVRIEQIALHVASSFGGAQFYLACGQIQITGGGSGTPGPLVSFPGAYTGKEPGILIDIYSPYPDVDTSVSGGYVAPGPAVWPPVGGGSPPPTKPSSSSTPAKPTSTPAKPSSTSSAKPSSSSAPAGSVALYGQCGGEGYTGPTACASGVCTASNSYYSQCLPA